MHISKFADFLQQTSQQLKSSSKSNQITRGEDRGLHGVLTSGMSQY